MFDKLCGKCDHKNCCTNSAVPLVFLKDLEKIKKKDLDYVKHLKTVKINDVDVYAVKKKPNSTECVYWDNDLAGCTIYESRPIDCRLYPFDILHIENEYHWIVYSCNVKSDWKWSEDYLKILECDDGFDDLMKNIGFFSEHTMMVLPTESEKTPYIVLRKVQWLSS